MTAKNKKVYRFPPIIIGKLATQNGKSSKTRKSGHDAYKKLMAQNKETK